MIITNPEVLSDPTVYGSPQVHLLADASQTQGNVSLQRVRLADGSDGAVPHFHKISCEIFFVLDGCVEFWEDGEISQISAGECAIVFPKTPHAFGAMPGQDADILIAITPGVERFEYFRVLSKIMRGECPANSLAEREEEFDTYFVDGTEWAAHRNSARP